MTLLSPSPNLGSVGEGGVTVGGEDGPCHRQGGYPIPLPPTFLPDPHPHSILIPPFDPHSVFHSLGPIQWVDMIIIVTVGGKAGGYSHSMVIETSNIRTTGIPGQAMTIPAGLTIPSRPDRRKETAAGFIHPASRPVQSVGEAGCVH